MRVADLNPVTTSLEASSDERLVLWAQEGFLDAYDETVRRHKRQLSASLFKFCLHQSELENLVQTAFIKAYQNLHRWRPRGKFKDWLLRVAVNTGHDYYRKRKNEPISVAQRSKSEMDEDPLDQVVDQNQAMGEQPRADLIEGPLLRLERDDRLVVTLHYYEGYSLSEIAFQLDWSLSKTKVRLHRARTKL